MKRFLSSIILSSIFLVTPAQAFISDWNVATPNRTGAAQYSNQHAFLGLFGAGTTHLTQTESEDSLSDYLSVCREDAPTMATLQTDTDLKNKFKSLFVSTTQGVEYNLLCIAELDQGELDGYDVIYDDGTVTHNLFTDPDVACNTTAVLDALYQEWLTSLTSTEEYDYQLSTENVEFNVGVLFGTTEIDNPYFNTFDIGAGAAITDDYDAADHVLESIPLLSTGNRVIEFGSRVHTRPGTGSQRRVLTQAQQNRFVQLFLSDANVNVIQSIIHAELNDAGIPATHVNRKFVRVSHRLLTFLFNREDNYNYQSTLPSLFEVEAFRLIDEEPSLLTLCEELNAVPTAHQTSVDNLITAVTFASNSTIDLSGYPNGVAGVTIYGDTATSADHYQIVSFDSILAALSTQLTATELAEAEAATSSANAAAAVLTAAGLSTDLQSVQTQLTAAQTALAAEQAALAAAQAELAVAEAALDDAEAAVARTYDFSFQANETVNNVRSLRLVRRVATANSIQQLQFDNDGQALSLVGTTSGAFTGVAGQLMTTTQSIQGATEGVLLRGTDDTGNVILCNYVQVVGQPNTTYLILVEQDDERDDESFVLSTYLVIDENQIQHLELDADGDVTGPLFNKVEGSSCNFEPAATE